MNTQKRTKYYFFFSEGNLLLQKITDNSYVIPTGEAPPFPIEPLLEVMNDGEMIAYTGEINTLPIKEGYDLIGLRASYDFLGQDIYQMAGKAFQINYWDKYSRFCPACGTPTILSLPIMKRCPNCKHEIFPNISTAILALIRKNDAILLVRAKNFKGPFHGLVAGFLETGETLEQCVAREVREEVGLEIKNIRYFANQSWPFPSGLMVGFIADYAAGEICLQEEELSAAAFYTRKNLPEIPRKLSLARTMIDWWIANP